MQIDPRQFRGLFFEEAAEHLETLEGGLVRLEDADDDPDLLNAIFRAVHSIKGGSGSFGLAEVATFTHALESVLDRLRTGSIARSRGLTDILLRAADVVRGLVASAQHGSPPPDAAEAVREELERVLARESDAAVRRTKPMPIVPPPPKGVSFADPPAESSAEPPRLHEVHIRFTPDPLLFVQGSDPLLVLRDLGEASEQIAVTTLLDALPPLAEMDPERCYLRFEARLRTEKSDQELHDLFAFVEDGSEIVIESAAAPSAAAPPAGPSPGPAAERARSPVERSSIRVPTEKVDRIINLVGELVIAQSMIVDAMQRVEGEGAADLREALSTMERNTRDLQERVMSVRMMPLSSVFQRFPRLVRDLCVGLGKDVDLRITGDEIELDKGVIERIGDPLVHLLRNSLDHGFEPAAERAALGKPEHGTLAVSAAHHGGTVCIQVKDDGRGLDIARIRRKAVALGMIAEDAELTTEQVHALLFAPGFSTADAVSDVSGRGVGMDVVKRNIEALNGSVSLASEPGRGTTCTIRLPLTLAILDGLSLGVGGQCFIVPLVNVVESFLPRQEDRKTLFGQAEIIQVRGENLPVIRLHRFFGLAGRASCERCLVTVIEHGARRVALVVDELLGQSQVVMKSLEANYQRVDGIGGATILGDGRVALILDLQALVRSVTSNARSAA